MGMGRATGGQMPTQQGGMGGKGGPKPMQSQPMQSQPQPGNMGGAFAPQQPQMGTLGGGQMGTQPQMGNMGGGFAPQQGAQPAQGGMGGKGGQMPPILQKPGIPPQGGMGGKGGFAPQQPQQPEGGVISNAFQQPQGGMGGKGGTQPRGTLVGIGPNDAPIYSNDPNAVPYTGGSMGGYFVNGVPGPAPQRPAYTGGQQPQMTGPQIMEMMRGIPAYDPNQGQPQQPQGGFGQPGNMQYRDPYAGTPYAGTGGPGAMPPGMNPGYGQPQARPAPPAFLQQPVQPAQRPVQQPLQIGSGGIGNQFHVPQPVRAESPQLAQQRQIQQMANARRGLLGGMR